MTGKKTTKRTARLLAAAALFVCLSACGRAEAVWNGETEYFAHLTMVTDVSDPYAYAGMVDYIFAGTVTGIEKIVLPEKGRQHEDRYSVYRIRVEENLKGTLTGEVVCSKLGGMKKDGTRMLVVAEVPGGAEIPDTGLPEAGKRYVFMAYGQHDGSLLLSELFDSRECSEELLAEYADYVAHETPYERQRFASKYDAGGGSP